MGRITLLVVVLVVLSAGCSRDATRGQTREPGHPELDESPPETVPEDGDDSHGSQPHSSEIPAVTPDNDPMMARRLRREQSESLRTYAAEAAPDDPFALTEKEIQELEDNDAVLY
ncbi:MAG: hypothetical protein PHR35_00740 [Kiritimatiellae bacterium]|nr:hypothetical protein [Kiritimatiellia bacterium]